LCLLLASFFAVLGGPFLRTFLRQWGEILPPLGAELWRDPYVAVAHQVARDRPVAAVRAAFQRVTERPDKPWDADVFRRWDPDNGIYDYLTLLAVLRAGKDDEAVLAALHIAERAHPACLYVMRQHRLAEDTFREAGIPPRRSARAARRMRYWIKGLRETHVTVLRELVGRLGELAARWREAGRFDRAARAEALAVRLLCEVGLESGMPDVVLLAADLLPTVLHGLAADVGAAVRSGPTIDSDGELQRLVTACAAAADQASSWRQGWFEMVRSEGLNVLPYTGLSYHVLLVPARHARVLRSLTASADVLGVWVVLCIAEVVLLVVGGVTWRRGSTDLGWRYGRAGSMVLAAVIVWGPLLGLLAVALPMRSGQFAWLLSMPTLRAVVLMPAWVLVMVGLAVRLLVRLPQEASGARWGAWVVMGLLAGTVVVGAVVWSRPTHPWSAPGCVRAIRGVGTLIGLEATLVWFVWVVGLVVRRVRGGLSVGLAARAWLHVISPALVAGTILAAVCLGINQRRDAAHQRAFLEAARDPVAACIGRNAKLCTSPETWLREACQAAERAGMCLGRIAPPQ